MLPWTGRDLSSLPDAYDGSTARCGIVAESELATAVPAMPEQWAYAQSGGRLWSLQLIPLLPHQHTCADLQASLDDVHAEELGKLISAY